MPAMPSPASPSGVTKTHWPAMMIIGAMFFIFGFVTWLNGPLISFVKLAFTLNDFDAFLVPMAFYMSYFFLAIPAAYLLKRTGLKSGMAIGLFMMSVGALVFAQFVNIRIFPGALIGLFVIGGGMSILQTASNPYISILGPIKSAAQRIAFMGIFNKSAGILAPIVLSQLVLSGIGDLSTRVAAADDTAARDEILNSFAHRIYGPYQIIALVLLIVAVAVYFSPLPRITDDANAAPAGTDRKSLFSYPQLWFGCLAIFFYCGTEVMAGDAIGTYGQGFGLPLDQTRFFTSFTLAAMLCGYVCGLILVPKWVSQERYLAFTAALGGVLITGAYFTTGYASVALVAALGFANSMMWPAIFPLGIRGLGRHTEMASAILIMGIAGGAVIPQAFAFFKAHYPFQMVFTTLLVPSYAFIFLFAIFARPRKMPSPG